LTSRLGSGGFSEPKIMEPKDGEISSSLYNMKEDPKEKNNVYEKFPEIVKELNTILEEQKQQL